MTREAEPAGNDDLASRSPELLRAAALTSLIERSLSALFGAESALRWMDLQDSSDVVYVARKAARVCSEQDAVTAGVLIDAIRDYLTEDAGAGVSLGDRSILHARLPDREIHAQTVVLDTLRAMFNAQSPEQIFDLLLAAVQGLGGRIVPPGEADAQAIPLNLAPSGQAPLLAAAEDLDAPDLLPAYLPRLVEDARRATALLSRSAYPPIPGSASGTADDPSPGDGR